MIKKINFTRIIPILVLLLLPPIIARAGQFKVIRVYNGDTLKAKGHGIEFKVRLVGIDAPEISKKKSDPGQPYSKEAKKFLENLVMDKVVFIKGYGLDRYNRILGEVSISEKNVNLEIIKAGLAEVDSGKAQKKFDRLTYKLTESAAKEAGVGMWSLGDQYISPGEWRKTHR
jgi:endonuclease YncB( thermonuclease family)